MASRQTSTAPMPDVAVGQYRIGKEIGRGSFATVFQGIHAKTKGLVAIKSVLRSKLNRKLLENLEHEIQILKTLNHPHIVALLDCQKSNAYIHLVMEYCSLGDLSMFIKKRDRLKNIPETAAMAQKYPSVGGGLNEVIVRHFVKQLGSALEFLRGRNLIHRDVKPQNLLLEPPVVTYGEDGPYSEPIVDQRRQIPVIGLPDLPVLKIADFGFARSLPSTSLAETLCGSPLYMAPEILRYEKYDAKADLWSVGTVLYEMVVGKPPFRASNHVELLRRIERGEDKIKFSEDCTASEDIRRLIRALLKRGPVERMSFNDFFNDSVLKSDIPNAILPGKKAPETTSPRLMERTSSKGKEVAQYSGTPVPDYFPTRHAATTPSTPLQMPQNQLGKQLSPSPFLDSERPPSSGAEISPRMAVNRTTTTVPLSPRTLSREGGGRPMLPHNATAPARPTERPSTGLPMERQISQQTASPSSSFLVQRQLQQQKSSPRDTKEAKDNAEQDALVEREYVVIEKRTVQVNAFADEMAFSPQVTGKSPSTTPPHSAAGAVARRIPSANQTPTRTVAKRPESYHQSRGSVGSSPGSTASSALARALTMAKTRLHGIGGLIPPSVFGTNPQNVIQQYNVTTLYQPGSLVMVGGAPTTVSPIADDDSGSIQAIEDAANRSDVVYQLAEIKLSQLIPTGGLDALQSPAGEDGKVNDLDMEPEAIVGVAEEALVLYVKTLALLSRAMDIATNWWTSTNGDLAPHQISPSRIAASARMNNAVQWVRERFNEVLEKAEFVRSRLQSAQKELPLDHPSHPSNHPESSATSLASNSDKVVVSAGVCAEKLMYERALETSRTAAVNELVGDDLAQCEVAYVNAIWMLEGVLETEEAGEYGAVASGREEYYIQSIDDDDRKVVEKFLAGIRGRLAGLRKKMATISRRSSGGVHSINNQGVSVSPPYVTP